MFSFAHLLRLNRGFTAALFILVFTSAPHLGQAAAQVEILKAFKEGIYGSGEADLCLAPDGHLYGVMPEGGSHKAGWIFRIDRTSGMKTIVANFLGIWTEQARGKNPLGGLVVDPQGQLWGTTSAGGPLNRGTIYKLDPASGQITTVIDFTGRTGANRGSSPQGTLLDDGAGFFWGITNSGGTNDGGTVFKIQQSTGLLTTLADFEEWGDPRRNPIAGLVQDGAGFLWGVTNSNYHEGSIFKVNIITGVLSPVLSFSGSSGSNRGYKPNGKLVYDGTRYLWGTTQLGTLFKVDATTGVPTTVLSYESSQTSPQKYIPAAGLALDGEGYLWGTAAIQEGPGAIFKVELATEQVTWLYDPLAHPATDIHLHHPRSVLVLDNAGFFWGTSNSGSLGGYGNAFKVQIGTGQVTEVTPLAPSEEEAQEGYNPYGGLISDASGLLWGTTFRGGVHDKGTVYKLDLESRKTTTVVSFSGIGGNARGALPAGTLLDDGAGYLWGTTYSGGAFDCGTVFKVRISDGEFTSLVEFDNHGASRGQLPSPDLASDGQGFIWGTTQQSGNPDGGTIFKINIQTGEFLSVVDFSSLPQAGMHPYAGLTPDGLGYLWGTTTLSGTVFKIHATTHEVSIVADFPSYSRPFAKLTDDGADHFWGTTYGGGTSNDGSVFKVHKVTGAFTTVTSFPLKDSSQNPWAPLVSDGAGRLWGTTSSYHGGIFRVNLETGAVTYHFYFPAAPESMRVPGRGGLLRLTDGKFYGTTMDGGPDPSGWNSNAGTIFRMTEDAETRPPLITSPATNGLYGDTIPLTFTNQELYTNHTTLTLDNGAGVVRTISGTWPVGGTHTIQLKASALSLPSQYVVTGGSTIPDGIYTFTMTSTDNMENAPASTVVTGVRIDTTAPTISVENFTEEASDPISTPVHYPAPTVTDAVGVASIEYSKDPGAGFALGETTVTVTAKDAAGHTSTASFVVKVQDTTAPSVTATPFVLRAGMNGTATLPDFRSQLNASDVMSPLTRTQTPAAGTVLAVGEHPLTFSVSDPAGNTTTSQTSVTVLAAEMVETTMAAASGSPAPATDGLDPSATLFSFFAPAISDQCDLAAKVNLKAGSKFLSAIYQQDPTGSGRLRAFQNQSAPNLEGVTFKSFGDPLLAGDGSIAFAATLQGRNAVTTGTDTSVWTDALGGGLRMVLREGSEVRDGLKLKAVSSFALRNDELLALATLQTARGQVTTTDDTVVLRLTESGTEVLLREGTEIVAGDRPQASKIKTISVLGPALGSPGHGRWQGEGATIAKATLIDGRTVILRLVSGENPAVLLVTQGPASELELTAKWTKFGLPVIGSAGEGYAVHGTLQGLRGEVTPNDDTALLYYWDGPYFDELVRENDLAFEDGPVFASFLDPIVNGNGEALFQGTLRGSGVTAKNKIGLWHGIPGNLELTARLGDPATDRAGDAVIGRTWTAFLSHALPDDCGPLFLAKISGPGIGVTNNLGLWSRGVDGKVREIVRLGDNIPISSEPYAPVRQIKTLTLLTSPAGVFGATRSFNATGSVAVLVTFTDKAQAILRLDLP